MPMKLKNKRDKTFLVEIHTRLILS